ncbi:MAG: single-stranded DNA-binding protein [Patescibacteria group bacterium]|jgi:single-strand DNA-binding protein
MNLNKAIIIGNLTANPEVKKTASGQTIANFSIATNRVWTNQQGVKQEQAEFHSIVAFGRLAEIVGQYLAKGRLCMVEGRIQTRNWVDTNNVKHWKTEIVAENIQLGPRSAASANGSYNQERPGNSGYDAAPAYEVEQVTAAPVANDNEEEIKVEDIPF